MKWTRFVCRMLLYGFGLPSLLLLVACGGGSSAAANPTLPVRTMQVSIPGGSPQTILTDSRGFALYFYIPDTPTKTACAGECAITWPPLLANPSGEVTSASPLPSKLTAQETTNGPQVEYNHHLLYTYAGDSGPGQVTGNGVNAWYVATPDLKAPSGFQV